MTEWGFALRMLAFLAIGFVAGRYWEKYVWTPRRRRKSKGKVVKC